VRISCPYKSFFSSPRPYLPNPPLRFALPGGEVNHGCHSGRDFKIAKLSPLALERSIITSLHLWKL
jgi:hypothetical protein